MSREITNPPSKFSGNIKCLKQNYFGEALKELRLEKKFTQEECAKLIGVTQAQWSAYETGRNRPSLDDIISIAKALKVLPFALLSRSLDKSNYFESPTNELSFEYYETLANDIIEKDRKRISKRKAKQQC